MVIRIFTSGGREWSLHKIQQANNIQKKLICKTNERNKNTFIIVYTNTVKRFVIYCSWSYLMLSFLHSEDEACKDWNLGYLSIIYVLHILKSSAWHLASYLLHQHHSHIKVIWICSLKRFEAAYWELYDIKWLWQIIT